MDLYSDFRLGRGIQETGQIQMPVAEPSASWVTVVTLKVGLP